MKLLSFAQGKKTYLVCAIGLAIGVANGFGYHEPGWIDWILAALGGVAMRQGITTQARQATIDTAALVHSILSDIQAKDGPIPSGPLTPEQERQKTAALNLAQLQK